MPNKVVSMPCRTPSKRMRLSTYAAGHRIVRRATVNRKEAILPTLMLLHRDALRQVAGLVDVGALGDGGVVGKELNGDGVEDGGDEGVDLRQLDRRPGPGGELLEAGG